MDYSTEMKKIEEMKEAIYASFDDSSLAKLEALDKRLNELEGMKAMESRTLQAVPEKPMTESQKWARKFIEAIEVKSSFADAMPREMAAEVIEKIGQYANVLGHCDVRVLASDLAVPVESGLPTVSYVTEGSAIGISEPAVGAVTLSPKMLACISKVSNILVKDATFDIVTYVEGAIARAIANKLDYEILFGAGGTTAIEGITKKTGIISATSATTLTLTWDEVRKALSNLKGYKANCTIVVGQAVADIIHGFKDSAGTYIFPQNEELTRIMGHEVVISDQMPEVATGAVLFVAGDFKQYIVGQREAIDVQLLYELYAGNNQTGIKTTVRYDGKVAQAAAFSVILSK